MLKRIWPFMSRYKKYLFMSCLCVMVETVFELVIPMLMADIIDVGVANRDTHYIFIRGILMIACAFFCTSVRSILCKIRSYGRAGICGRIKESRI